MEALKDYSRQLISELNKSLQKIRSDNLKAEEWSRLSITESEIYLEKLRAYLISNPFSYRSEEVYFFKEVKPRFMGELIYYCEIYNLLIGLPFSGQEQKLNYLSGRLDYVVEFFRYNSALYEYYQKGETAMDNNLFVRKPVDRFTFRDFPLNIDPVYFYGDKIFSTGFDFLFAQFAAFEKLQLFLEAKMKAIMIGNDVTKQEPVKFTGTGGDFVEMVNIFKALGRPVDTETGNPASEEQLAEFLKTALNADWGKADDFQTLKVISNASDLRERMLDNIEELRKKWDKDDKDVKYE